MTMTTRPTVECEGISGPYELDRKDLLAEIEAAIRFEGARKDRHIDFPAIANFLKSDGNLYNAVSHTFGRELDIWRTNFFYKTSGSGEVGWHHDRHFETGDQNIDLANTENHFSVLIAITDLLEEDGVIEYIPFSHLPLQGFERDVRPFHKKAVIDHFLNLPVELVDRRRSMPLKRGQFALFHSALLHRSLPFRHGSHRISMVIRLCRRHTLIPEELLSLNGRQPYN
ncbi:phytanoyl-CoA dioxygenase family protein [Gilvimarinus algae]|uniref:Phytanoyl-CoA dioxygenase family protein n=1 Tax=Gilvimarinus algae TaxID=3058037 RepID=A0ABT8TIB5_9GAMM|nr:phytanoyl-CoA dioxygenase family protein [Gilvimarinus sp. SDUM040014]MDO3383229.1 phytanoyl-CoA dioxygenase family protein [Gilvimarinus sp. SDUM040014]